MDYDLPIPVGETFYAAFDLSLSIDQIDSINATYGVVRDHLVAGFESLYCLRNTDSTGMRILELANSYHLLDCVHFARPNFGIRAKTFNYKLYDCYNMYQDNIKNVIGQFNQKSVWDFAGLDNEVAVAVIDDGVESHSDLPESRILPGHDFFNDDNDASPGTAAHGMACAGIIAASHTTDSAYAQGWYPFTGIISLNQNANILPIRCFDDNGFAPWEDCASSLAFAYEQEAEVISCSWGADVSFNIPDVDSAIRANYYSGRNGLGTPMFFASGNSGEWYPGTVAYPAYSPYVCAVGAVDLNDSLWYYSQYGDFLDVVAPSDETDFYGDVWSLDQMGDDGFNGYWTWAHGDFITWDCPTIESNDNNMMCHFGGTSAACPIAAGIASLLISRRPDLPVDTIYKIIKESAVKDLAWGYTVNPPDYHYGYGRVDAFRAMLSITRGDANNDASVDVGDAIYIIQNVYNHGPDPIPDVLTGDANCDGEVGAADATFLINYIFSGGPAPQICFEY